MPEQTRVDWNQLMEEALTAPGQLGNVYNRLHEYSFGNNLLFLSQGVREPVASWKRWQSLGRHVLQGARAKQVIVPIIIKDRREEAEESDGANAPDKRVVGFKLVRGVFALSDTDGPELPPVQLPTWDLQHALATLAIKQVPFQGLNGNIQGYAVEREIAINPIAAHPEKTLFHELGHVVLGHTVASSLGEYATHRGLMEFQAESTAYLSLNEVGRMDEETASHSRGYIRHWLQDERPGERAIRLVFAATDQILRAGRVAIGAVSNAEGKP